MISAVNDKVKISCLETGLSAGEPAALLIHGMNANMAFWHPLLARRLGSRRRLLMFDLRGHGYSDLPRSGYKSEILARDAEAVLDAFEVDSADIVAHSFGATVALQLVRLCPQRVRSLTILDGHVLLLQPRLRLCDWSQFDRWRNHFEAAGVTLDPNLALDFETPLHIEDADWAMAKEGLIADGFFAPNGGKRAAARYRRLMTETEAPRELRNPSGLSLEALRQVAVPTLALYGSQSPYLPTQDGLVREIPHCQTGMLDDVGHNFPILRPGRTADAIEAFWAPCSGQRVAS